MVIIWELTTSLTLIIILLICIKISHIEYIKYWKKCRVSENGKISIKKEDIEKYIKIEEDLSDNKKLWKEGLKWKLLKEELL